MFFENGRTVYRQRARTFYDPISDSTVEGDWTNPDESPIEGAAIGQSSTSTLADATRTGALEAMSLYCQVGTDVHSTDRVRDGAVVYAVDGIPAEFINPFTGWAAGMEVPLRRVIG